MRILRKSRIEELISFDEEHNCTVIGTDEVGRGPIAGPVVASAVYFPEINEEVLELIKFIDDSKKFTSNPKLRKTLSENIKKVAKYSIQECSVDEIETYNILQASLLAMKKCCDDLIPQMNKEKDDILILIDGTFTIKQYNYNQKSVKKGDSTSASIAAASILAKVYRDELMHRLSEEYPAYNWQKNKGYPTKAHIEAVKEHGYCHWHRKSFLSKFMVRQCKLF